MRRGEEMLKKGGGNSFKGSVSVRFEIVDNRSIASQN